MLTINAELIHKPTTMKQPVCQIEEIIELSKNELDTLISHPHYDQDFIAEHCDLMGEWDGAYHCLLALDEGGNDGILIESEGSGYVRYGAYVPHARDFVERELERTASHLIKNALPDPEIGVFPIFLNEISEMTGADVTEESGIARMFARILENHPAISGIEVVDDYIVVTPVEAQGHNYISEHQQDLIDRILGYFGEYHSSHELYDILHGSLKMSQEDTELLGFDLSEHFENKELTQTGGMEMN